MNEQVAVEDMAVPQFESRIDRFRPAAMASKWINLVILVETAEGFKKIGLITSWRLHVRGDRIAVFLVSGGQEYMLRITEEILKTANGEAIVDMVKQAVNQLEQGVSA